MQICKKCGGLSGTKNYEKYAGKKCNCLTKAGQCCSEWQHNINKINALMAIISVKNKLEIFGLAPFKWCPFCGRKRKII